MITSKTVTFAVASSLFDSNITRRRNVLCAALDVLGVQSEVADSLRRRNFLQLTDEDNCPKYSSKCFYFFSSFLPVLLFHLFERPNTHTARSGFFFKENTLLYIVFILQIISYCTFVYIYISVWYQTSESDFIYHENSFLL